MSAAFGTEVVSCVNPITHKLPLFSNQIYHLPTACLSYTQNYQILLFVRFVITSFKLNNVFKIIRQYVVSNQKKERLVSFVIRATNLSKAQILAEQKEITSASNLPKENVTTAKKFLNKQMSIIVV